MSAAIPIEIWTDIFFNAISNRYHDETELPLPVLLGAVCRSWRAIAWGFPGFWTHLRVTFSADTESVQNELIQEWISRSGTRPLKVQLELDTGRRQWEPSARIAQTLLSTANRWTMFEFSGEPYEMFLQEMNRQRYDYPLLKYISIIPTGPDDSELPWAFKHAPSLRRAYFEHHIPRMIIEWSQLHELQVEAKKQDFMAALDSASPSLKSCTVLLNDTPGFPSLPFRLIKLPFLTHLFLDLDSDFQPADPVLCGILDSLELPALSKLIVHLNPSEPEDEEDEEEDEQLIGRHIVGLVSRSKCRLRTLKLHGLTIVEPKMIEFLLHIPSVENLTLSFPAYVDPPPFSHDLVESLDPTGTEFVGHYCLPRLKRFHYTGPVDFDPVNLTAMLRARLENASDYPVPAPKNTCCAPKTVRIKYCNESWGQSSSMSAFRKAFTVLQETGLDIQVIQAVESNY